MTTVQVSTNLSQHLERVRERIARACDAAGRNVHEIQLIAVSKTVDAMTVRQAAALGLRDFGENRVQDAGRKFADVADDRLRLHLIGPLQTNKVRAALKIADSIQSVDRDHLIETLEQQLDRLAECGELRGEQPFPVLLQVNVAGEEQKSGCAPDEAARLVERLLASNQLRLEGLMTIAPLVEKPEQARPTFAGLRNLRDDLQRRYPAATLADLSMGMTNDFEQAIHEGATMIRVGRAIFAG